jgi:hypothetical protein
LQTKPALHNNVEIAIQNEALLELKNGRIRGAKVLKID